MKTKAILFDKDGTLLSLDAFWVTISNFAVKDIIKAINCPGLTEEEVLFSFGIEKGEASILGSLAYGTYDQMGTCLYEVLKKKGFAMEEKRVCEIVTKAYFDHAEKGVLCPICPNLKEVLAALKERGIYLAVATADSSFTTKVCLDGLGITELFDEIYTVDSGLAPKPSSDYMEAFQKKTGVKREEMLMVGDTLTDVAFAKNGGIDMIGIAKNEKNRRVLLEHIDTVISDFADLLQVVE